MNVLVRNTILVLFMWLMLAGVCLGKQVYLKDGGIIESQSAWRQGNKVFVKVNRDIVADFNPSEIDLRRTFPKTGASSRHLRRKVSAVAATAAAATAHAPAPGPTAATSAPNPAVQPNPPVVTPAPKPAEPAASEPPRPPESQPAMVMTQQGTATVMSGGFPIMAMLAFLAVCLLIIAAQWVIFERAGQAGWKSLIPFYNMYILMIISGKPGWWMFLLFVPLVGVVVFLLAMLSLAKKFRRSELFGVGIFILPMIFLPLLAFGGSEYEG